MAEERSGKECFRQGTVKEGRQVGRRDVSAVFFVSFFYYLNSEERENMFPVAMASR